MRHTSLHQTLALGSTLFMFGALNAQVYDDIYYTPGSTAPQTTTSVSTNAEEAEELFYYPADDSDYSVYSDNYDSEKYYDEEGNSYVVNNYYYDEYEDSYMTDIYRYYEPYYGFGYYSPCYSPYSYYPTYYNPWYGGFGFSIGFGFGWGSIGYGWGYPSYGWGNPYYGYGYGNPYYGYSSYWNGYYNGYYDGYYGYGGYPNYGYSGNDYYYGPHGGSGSNTGGGDRTYSGFTDDGGGTSDRVAGSKTESLNLQPEVANINRANTLDRSNDITIDKNTLTVRNEDAVLSNNSSVKVIKSYTAEKSPQGSVATEKNISGSKSNYQYKSTENKNVGTNKPAQQNFDKPTYNNNTIQKESTRNPEFAAPDRNHSNSNRYTQPPVKEYKNEYAPEKPKSSTWSELNDNNSQNKNWGNTSKSTPSYNRSSTPASSGIGSSGSSTSRSSGSSSGSRSSSSGNTHRR